MRTIVLGYVFDLDFSNAPKGDEIGIKRQKRDNNVRQTTRLTYGEVQTGVLTFGREGVYLQDWFESYEGKVGDGVPDFHPNGANNGWNAVGYEVNGGTVSLYMSDGDTVLVNVNGFRVNVVDAEDLNLNRDDYSYLATTARALVA